MPLSEAEVRPDSAGAIPRLICVIVNWNGATDTLACLASLRAQDYPALRVVVVDNGSTDDSVARIRATFPDGSEVTMLDLPRNLGYAAGSNAGIRWAHAQGAEFFWLLNNDTEVPPETASRLVRKALDNPGAGAIGAVLYYRHDPARVQAWGGGRVSLTSAYVSHFTASASFVPRSSFLTGASLLLSRRVIEQVGLLYEGFFMYSDDADLCLRLRNAGYTLVVAEDTAILHAEGGSSIGRSASIDQFSTTSTLRLLQRHAPAPPVAMTIYLGLRLLNRLRAGSWANLAAVVRGARVFWRERHRAFSDQL